MNTSKDTLKLSILFCEVVHFTKEMHIQINLSGTLPKTSRLAANQILANALTQPLVKLNKSLYKMFKTRVALGLVNEPSQEMRMAVEALNELMGLALPFINIRYVRESLKRGIALANHKYQSKHDKEHPPVAGCLPHLWLPLDHKARLHFFRKTIPAPHIVRALSWKTPAN